jgi:hypothetical protein
MVANIYGSVVHYAPGAIQQECDLLMNGPGTPLQNLADVINLSNPADCLHISYQGYIDWYQNITEPFDSNHC